MEKVRNIYPIFLVICLIGLLALSLYLFKPQIEGDGVSYIEAINFLENNTPPSGLIMNRILTTFGGLEIIILFSKFGVSIPSVWLSMNIFFYILAGLAFYKILEILFDDGRVALLGSLFLASNYALMSFGLNYLMDLGGWAFYLLSILGTLRYADNSNRKNLLGASFFVGVGGLFKEYALLASLPIAIFLIYENRHSFLALIKKSILPTILCFAPIFTLYLYIYKKYDYTYLDWLSINQETYVYASRTIEYIKSLGSLLNILGILFLLGLYTLWREREKLTQIFNEHGNRINLFLVSVLVSTLPIFVWPAITQRILFITVPFIIIISCYFIKKHINKYYLFVPVLILYILSTIFMDSYLLTKINLPF